MAERKLASVQYVHDVAPIEGADCSMTSRPAGDWECK